MGLSTHVLDTMNGCPAAGMAAELHEVDASGTRLVKRFSLNADGRAPDGLLYRDGEMKKGRFRLVFDVSGYFRSRGVQLAEPNFLDQVTLDFGVSDPGQHYHVPLLVSPWSYSTYRGS